MKFIQTAWLLHILQFVLKQSNRNYNLNYEGTEKKYDVNILF